MAQPQDRNTNEAPRYRLTERCYLNDRLYDPDEMALDQNAEPLEDGTQPRKALIIAFRGVPAHYMEPVNDAAKAMCAKHPDRMRFIDPVNSLNIVGPGAEMAKA